MTMCRYIKNVVKISLTLLVVIILSKVLHRKRGICDIFCQMQGSSLLR